MTFSDGATQGCANPASPGCNKVCVGESLGMPVESGTTRTVVARSCRLRASPDTTTTVLGPLPDGSVGLSTHQISPRTDKSFFLAPFIRLETLFRRIFPTGFPGSLGFVERTLVICGQIFLTLTLSPPFAFPKKLFKGRRNRTDTAFLSNLLDVSNQIGVQPKRPPLDTNSACHLPLPPPARCITTIHNFIHNNRNCTSGLCQTVAIDCRKGKGPILMNR